LPTKSADFFMIDDRLYIWLSTVAQLTKINTRTITSADADIPVSDVVTCLGVVIDSQLTFTHNVKKLSYGEEPESLSHLALNPYRVVTDGQTHGQKSHS